jgi:hypothetical protein
MIEWELTKGCDDSRLIATANGSVGGLSVVTPDVLNLIVVKGWEARLVGLTSSSAGQMALMRIVSSMLPGSLGLVACAPDFGCFACLYLALRCC